MGKVMNFLLVQTDQAQGSYQILFKHGNLSDYSVCSKNTV